MTFVHNANQNNALQGSKPLLWEKLKDTQRFQFLDKEKVEHVIVEENKMQRVGHKDEW